MNHPMVLRSMKAGEALKAFKAVKALEAVKNTYNKVVLPDYPIDSDAKAAIKVYNTIKPTTVLTEKHLKALDTLINDGVEIDNKLYERFIPALITYMKTHKPDAYSMACEYCDCDGFEKFSVEQIEDAIMVLYNGMLADELEDLKDALPALSSDSDEQISVKHDVRSALFYDWSSWMDTYVRESVYYNIEEKPKPKNKTTGKKASKK